MEPASDPKGLSPAKQRLLETKLRLADADEEISGTLAHLQRLQLRRKDILVDLNILTSPILNLPPEIICEIFIHCLPPPRTLPDPRDAPLLLGHVCRRWRSIAYSFTQLWSSVTVSDVLSAMLLPPPRAGLLDMLDAWLIHSGDNLLSVSIVPDAQNPDIPLVLGRSPVFGTIRHTSHRWRELEIVRRLEDFQVLLNRDAPWNLPHLVKLTLLLANNGRHPSGFPPNLLSNLNDAPALREVHVMGFAPLNLLIPWSQLTTVHAENLLPIECLQTLAATTSLIDGTFSIWIEQFFHLPATAPIARPPRLTSLTLSGELCTGLLDHIELPSIKKFSLSIGPNDDFGPLVAFFARSSTLKEVALDIRGAVPPADLITCLEAMAGIETLSFGVHTGLMNGPLPWALLSNFALLPSIRRLTIRERIDRYHEPPLDEGGVAEMLAARWAGGAGTLKSFCLVTTHLFCVGGAVHPGFAALAEEGMGIVLRSHGAGPFRVVYFDSAKQSSRSNGKGKGKARAL